jgi:uncharacterized RDD family membrane protein YckC
MKNKFFISIIHNRKKYLNAKLHTFIKFTSHKNKKMNPVGVGTRVINFVVDTVIISLLAYAAYNGWTFYVTYYNVMYFPFYDVFAAVAFLYYLFFEGIWRRTPGKWMSLTKVVDVSGKRASFGQIILRCIVRIVGIILIDSLFLPILGKTLHDYLSQTYVSEV